MLLGKERLQTVPSQIGAHPPRPDKGGSPAKRLARCGFYKARGADIKGGSG